MATKDNDSCREKAAEDEPIFTLRAQDKLAPTLVELWANHAERRGAPPEKVAEARGCAAAMRAWQRENPSKWPD